MERRQEEGIDIERRLLLKKGALATLVTLAGVLLPRDSDEISRAGAFTKTREEFQAHILKALAEPEKLALPPEAKLIPEWERTGSDILIAISSKNGDIDSALRNRWDSILHAFPPHTRVYVVAAGKAGAFVESSLRPQHDHLQFSVYPLPCPGFYDDEIFAQDIIFATGSRDSSGRFQLLASDFDHRIMREGSFESQQTGSVLLIDELLAERYPKVFKTHQVAVICEGGDMEITRLPNGKSALVVGTSVMVRMVCYLASLMSKQTGESYAMSVPEAFTAVEEYYRKTFNVEEVIVLNPGSIFRACSLVPKEYTPHLSSVSFTPAFYHQDMIVRPTVDPKGKYVAFCTTIDPSTMTLNPYDEILLRQARVQFEVLGYEIVDLPFGIEPAQNYTNVQMFTPSGKNTTVLLPQYGHPFDNLARSKYEQRGYTVIPVDFSGADPDDFSGSVHCLTEVLA